METTNLNRLVLAFLLVVVFPTFGLAIATVEKDGIENDPVIKAVRDYCKEQISAERIKKDTPNWKSRLPKFPTITFPAGSCPDTK